MTFRPPHWMGRLLGMLLAGGLAACGSDGPTEPPPDTSRPTTLVLVSGDGQRRGPGEILPSPLVVRVDDQFGNLMAGVRVMFSVSTGGGSVSPGSALTGSDGRAQAFWTLGPPEGEQTLEASATGVTSVTFRATASRLVLVAIAPDTLRAGQSATLTGQGFDPDPGSNAVTVGGLAATVTTASPDSTSLTITVPTRICRPLGPVSVRVSVQGQPSNAVNHPFAPAAFLSLVVGEQRIMRDALDFCLQFGASALPEAYLIGVQSVSEAVSSLTPVLLTSAAGAGAVPSPPLVSAATAPTGDRPLSVFGASPRDRRWARHRAAEVELRRLERTILAGPVGPVVQAVAAAGPSRIPPTVAEGDTVDIRVPDLDNTPCVNFIPIKTVARKIGTRGVWLEDVENSPNGFITQDWQDLSDQLDTPIYPTDAAYFGDATDIDGNGRVGIVVTKEVNRSRPGLLGFVISSDFFASGPGGCPSSNEGEVYYGRAPDSAGTFGAAYLRQDALDDAPFVIAHELAHIIQFGRRLTVSRPIITQWEAEAQATLAEEVVGHAAEGNTTGQNYGRDIAQNRDNVGIDWYGNGFSDLALFYGFETRTTRVTGAPEQCSWLTPTGAGNDGPCIGGRQPYAGWSFLRWLSDHFGPSRPGGEQSIHRALIDNSLVGFANIENVIGVPIDSLLAQWAAMLYIDDRVVGAAARLTLPSWDMFDIFERGIVESGRLRPEERAFQSFTDTLTVRGGSLGYFRVSNAVGRPATAIRVRDRSDQPLPSIMRLWVVRLQ